MTLLEVRTQDGKLVSRCDQRCYEAKGHVCRCVCMGKNHGIGYRAALEQTLANMDDWEQEFARQEGLAEYKMNYGPDVYPTVPEPRPQNRVQPTLFDRHGVLSQKTGHSSLTHKTSPQRRSQRPVSEPRILGHPVSALEPIAGAITVEDDEGKPLDDGIYRTPDGQIVFLLDPTHHP